MAAIDRWLAYAAFGIEVLAVLLITGHILFGTVRYLRGALSGRAEDSRADYERYRLRLGRSLLLGLEILVAADVIRTAALDPTPRRIAVLGLLVLIRTFLSWSVTVEVEGRWPWQRRTSVPVA